MKRNRVTKRWTRRRQSWKTGTYATYSEEELVTAIEETAVEAARAPAAVKRKSRRLRKS